MQSIINKLKETGFIIFGTGEDTILFAFPGPNSPFLKAEKKEDGSIVIAFAEPEDNFSPCEMDFLQYVSINEIPKVDELKKDIERIAANDVAHVTDIAAELGIEPFSDDKGADAIAGGIKAALVKIGVQTLVCGQYKVPGFAKEESEQAKDEPFDSTSFSYFQKERTCGIILFAADREPHTNVRVIRFAFPDEFGRQSPFIISGFVVVNNGKYNIQWEWAFNGMQDMLDHADDAKSALCNSGIVIAKDLCKAAWREER